MVTIADSVPFFYTVTGTLKGYDALLNLVLDEVEEDIRGEPLLAPIAYHRKFDLPAQIQKLRSCLSLHKSGHWVW